ncbi:secretory phospholipase A2 receptor-like isoform X1 [Silurus asotus]|uniref:Secretory phospholipase A2 receptor-like isoform X1 n=1 Tax=Silurus asotus TaxID=30991 RepID=A0AAD5FD91_SILAS|nr:secretory phospholipase A2 receptor-like isoform X1 [Silurus asotus]
MKLMLLYLLCLTSIGPVMVSSQRISHILILQNKTWADAQDYCRTLYIDLTTAKSLKSLLTVKNLLALRSITGPVWMGLNLNLDTWRWSFNGRLLNDITLRMWGAGEPNNYMGHEWCGAIDGYGLWYDTTCTSLKISICYSASDPNMYVGVTVNQNWTNAQAYCRQWYTDLASPFNSTENSMVQNISLVQGYSWFGLSRDTWRWVDGTKVPEYLWQYPLPDNAVPQENCGTLNGGKLDDKQCTNKYYFICDAFPLVKYVVMLHVKSDQSVFDPAVQSAMLLQIKQKLDGGLKVYWRVQADGKIFQKKTLSYRFAPAYFTVCEQYCM